MIPSFAMAVPLAAGATLFLLEQIRPRRKRTEAAAPRWSSNLTMAAMGAGLAHGVELPISLAVARLAVENQWGVLQILPLPAILRPVAAFLLLDYTMYWWHYLAHRLPLLWRFHLVHHIDRELDSTTALRFHMGELVLSLPWRVGQVLLIGVAPHVLFVWQLFLLVSTLFHHSNLSLPDRVEDRLAKMVVTPRMHAIHHSCAFEERESNWSSGLSMWDRLHGSIRLGDRDSPDCIGHSDPIFRRPLSLRHLLLLPFFPAAERAL